MRAPAGHRPRRNRMHGAVVGSGIAGIAMAHALRNAGIAVSLFEKDLEPRSTGYQLNVLANGMYALSAIGLADALQASGCGAPLRSAPFFDGHTGRLLASVPVSGVGTEVSPRSFFRRDLHRALLGALQGEPPERGRELETVIDEPGWDKVRLRFTDGETRDFDFVVGADGAHSRIRALMYPQHSGYRARWRGLLFAIHVDLAGESDAERRFAAQLRDGQFVQFAGPSRSVVLAPAGGSRFGVILAGPEIQDASDDSTPERVRQLAREVVKDFDDPRIHYAIDRASWGEGNPFVWHIGDIDPLPRFHAGRVALAGDAAHAMIPVVGQGANQAFEDAMVLANELGIAANSEGDVRSKISMALQRYSDERQPHVAHIQAVARRRASAMSFNNVLGYRMSLLVFRWLPQFRQNRFENHLLKYAIGDPGCSIGGR